MIITNHRPREVSHTSRLARLFVLLNVALLLSLLLVLWLSSPMRAFVPALTRRRRKVSSARDEVRPNPRQARAALRYRRSARVGHAQERTHPHRLHACVGQAFDVSTLARHLRRMHPKGCARSSQLRVTNDAETPQSACVLSLAFCAAILLCAPHNAPTPDRRRRTIPSFCGRRRRTRTSTSLARTSRCGSSRRRSRSSSAMRRWPTMATAVAAAAAAVVAARRRKRRTGSLPRSRRSGPSRPTRASSTMRRSKPSRGRRSTPRSVPRNVRRSLGDGTAASL